MIGVDVLEELGQSAPDFELVDVIFGGGERGEQSKHGLN